MLNLHPPDGAVFEDTIKVKKFKPLIGNQPIFPFLADFRIFWCRKDCDHRPLTGQPKTNHNDLKEEV